MIRVLLADDHTLVRAGFRAGYLLKDATVTELERAIRAVTRGEQYVSPAIAHGLAELPGSPPARPDLLEPLTPRHREVLGLIAQDNTNKQIAARLGISPKTVDAHRTELMTRLDIHDVAGLVRYAIRAGLVTTD